MNVYRITISKITAKGKYQECAERFVQSNLEATAIKNHFYKQYYPLAISVEEIREIETVNADVETSKVSGDYAGYYQSNVYYGNQHFSEELEKLKSLGEERDKMKEIIKSKAKQKYPQLNIKNVILKDSSFDLQFYIDLKQPSND